MEFDLTEFSKEINKSYKESLEILKKTIFKEYNVESLGFERIRIDEKRMYSEKIPAYADVMSLEEWESALNDGFFCSYDGYGFWVKDGMECSDEVFSSPKLDATHVAWYNK